MATRGRRAKYPWPKWTDGEPHKIMKGVDYTLSTYNLQISLHGHARAHNMRVVTRSFTESDGLNSTREGLTFTFVKEVQ